MGRVSVKKKDYENLSPANIEKVKALLNPPKGQTGSDAIKPITKKQACDILNISYNTTRLTNIIEEHDDRREYTKKRKADLRGRPASETEINEICTSFLQGDTVTDIAKMLFRSSGFVRAVLERVGVPKRPSNKEERVTAHYFPDECVSEDFACGEIAWSATYHSTVIVKERLTPEFLKDKEGMSNYDYEGKYGCPCYSIYVIQKIDSEDTYFSNVQTGGFSAYAPAYELGKLTHLEKYGINLERL